MYTLKSIARRGSALGGAFALLVASFAPAIPVHADALNPLTDRSLTLSSSSPGWSYTDGSGNSTYAPPNSGANGQKTGNTFDFKVSSSATVNTMSFQYCTTSAGDCIAPGNNSGTAPSRGADTASTSDLNVATSSPTEVSSGNFSTVVDASDPDGRVKAVPGFSNPLNPSDSTGVYAAHSIAQNFTVYSFNGSTWDQSTGWTMSAISVETTATTGKNNYIILTNASGESFTAGTRVKVVFFGTANNYITNPGGGAFFVKINTYNKEYNASPTGGQVGLSGLAPATDANIIDGGVTVANVMNQSIQITTKVLETMQFSVGTVDPNTLDSERPDGATVDPENVSELDIAHGNPNSSSPVQHQVCDTILKSLTPAEPANVLKLGDQNAESSLSTERTYSTHSYWRLSSNSSAGATVYYSGHTLSNTVGDQISPINAGNPGVKAAPARGAEQFGLALANTGIASDAAYSSDTTGSPVHQKYSVNYDQETPYENGNDNGKTSIHTTSLTADGVIGNASWHAPQLYPLVPAANYNNGTGSIDGGSATTEFAFDPTSDTIPVALATEDSEVVDCVTGKMRYIANIAATTPAGIYTTKVNYIAAPQY